MAAAETIIFGTQRLRVTQPGTRRLFKPAHNQINDTSEAANANPRAILRMVSRYN